MKEVYKGLQGVTGGYKWLQEVTVGDRGIHLNTEGLQRVTGGYNWLQGVTRG